MRRRTVALLMSLLAGQAAAGPFVEAVQRDWLGPRAADFARDGAALVPVLETLCAATPERAEADLAQAREHWLRALSSWETLAGVAVGPVLERRAQRRIDFTPTRPRMIEKAIRAEPKGPADMELVGTPAKGLPALEWLLWSRPVQPGTPGCRYAVRVAEEIRAEAAALAAARPATQDDTAFLAELVNQWVGGVERLRWPGMEMPLRVAMTSVPAAVPDFPRRDSHAAPLAWSAQWRALRGLALEGEGSLRAALESRGQTEAAAALAQAVAAADAAMGGLTTGEGTRILAAAKSLAGLKALVESRVAPALGVNIGFSDADGD